MKHETPGTQQLRHINKMGEGVSTAQRSDSPVQPINQRFPKPVLSLASFNGIALISRMGLSYDSIWLVSETITD